MYTPGLGHNRLIEWWEKKEGGGGGYSPSWMDTGDPSDKVFDQLASPMELLPSHAVWVMAIGFQDKHWKEDGW